MQDIIAALILIIILGGAIWYIYRAKKNGARCIGCSAAGCCAAKSGKKTEEVTLTPEILAAFPHICTLNVAGMTCEKCSCHLEQAFYSRGYLCKADWKTGTAEVRATKPVAAETLGEIVAEAGYICDSV